jgi:hypothetical protein
LKSGSFHTVFKDSYVEYINTMTPVFSMLRLRRGTYGLLLVMVACSTASMARKAPELEGQEYVDEGKHCNG